MCDQQSLRSACAYAQSDQSLCLSLEYSMIVKLLTKRYLEFLSLKGGCTGSSKSTLVKMSNCWKSHALAQFILLAITKQEGKQYLFAYSHFDIFGKFTTHIKVMAHKNYILSNLTVTLQCIVDRPTSINTCFAWSKKLT